MLVLSVAVILSFYFVLDSVSLINSAYSALLLHFQVAIGGWVSLYFDGFKIFSSDHILGKYAIDLCFGFLNQPK